MLNIAVGVIIRRSRRVGRANDQPNDRIHRTIILKWQKNMIDYIKRHRNVRHVIDYEKELIEQFETISFDDNNVRDIHYY